MHLLLYVAIQSRGILASDDWNRNRSAMTWHILYWHNAVDNRNRSEMARYNTFFSGMAQIVLYLIVTSALVSMLFAMCVFIQIRL